MTHNFLARTHHVRSIKKLASLGTAAERLDVFVLFKFGKPGIFYCQGSQRGVNEWSKQLKQLNYMGYALCSATNEIVYDADAQGNQELGGMGMMRVDSTAEFARHMADRGVLEWWRKRMGFIGD